jgi:hypothetical protein
MRRKIPKVKVANMESFSPTLVVNKKLVAISYTTDPPREVIHPWVGESNGHQVVCCLKEHITLNEFLKRLASGEEGLRVRARRPSNGRNTTISFARKDRVNISPELTRLLLKLIS